MEFINNKYIKNVSLITVVYNEADNITNFLQSYFEQEFYAEEFIVIDGGSEDSTFEILKKYSESNPDLNLKITSDVRFSKSYSDSPIADARNAAIELARCDYVAVTDAGCLLNKSWLYEIVKPFEDNTVDVVSGWYEAICDNGFQRRFADIFLPKKDDTNSKDFLPSSRSIAFKKSCWKAINGYPNKSHYGEDTMYDILLKEKGFKFYFAPKAVVYWHAPANLNDACRKYFNYGTGDGYYKLHRMYYLKLIVHALIPVKYLITGDFVIKYRIYFSLLRGYFTGIVRRIKS